MGMLFLDISKAFDCILHERLLYKLNAVGCSDHVLLWFRSCLSRKQVVTYNGIQSPSCVLPTGIGQGTILAPLRFIFYRNDIVDNLFFVKLSMYADDCVLYLSGNNWLTIKNKFQEDLECFERWGELNNLIQIFKKLSYYYYWWGLELSNLGYIEPLRVYGKDVDIVGYYLGAIMDSEMSLRSHCYCGAPAYQEMVFSVKYVYVYYFYFWAR